MLKAMLYGLLFVIVTSWLLFGNVQINEDKKNGKMLFDTSPVSLPINEQNKRNELHKQNSASNQVKEKSKAKKAEPGNQNKVLTSNILITDVTEPLELDESNMAENNVSENEFGSDYGNSASENESDHLYSVGNSVEENNVLNDNYAIYTSVQVQASFPGGASAWKKYLTKNLDATVPFSKSAPDGIYAVSIQFVVNLDGEISEVRPLTNFGFGMEEEAIRVIKRGPKWIPAMHNEKFVKAYRVQTVIFIVQ
jgi:cytoskeletal protein RodZ